MKRETGVNPVRTRHRNWGAKSIYHWETGKMTCVMIHESGDLPDFKYTGVCFKPRVIGCTKDFLEEVFLCVW